MIRPIICAGILLFLFLTSPAYAIGNIYLDGIGAFTQTNDAENQFGGGGTLLYGISEDFNFFIKNIFNTRKIGPKTAAGKEYYDKYNYFMSTAGIEYLYNINKMPLFWKSSLGIGAGALSIKKNYDAASMRYLIDEKETGLCIAFWTGMMYVFTQHISTFIDLGFHKTFYFDKLEDADIMGAQVLVGARFTVWGVNKSIYSEY